MQNVLAHPRVGIIGQVDQALPHGIVLSLDVARAEVLDREAAYPRVWIGGELQQSAHRFARRV
jgi:hypothetical protein